MQASDLLNGLHKVKRTGRGTWRACCPAHDSKSQTLAIRETEDGTILLHCFAGCSVPEIAGAMGVDLAELFPPKPKDEHGKPMRNPWFGMDVLKCVAQEALIVAIAAQGIHDGRALSAEDLARVHLANKRLNDAVEAARADR